MDERTRWRRRAEPWGEWATRLAEAAARFDRPPYCAPIGAGPAP